MEKRKLTTPTTPMVAKRNQNKSKLHLFISDEIKQYYNCLENTSIHNLGKCFEKRGTKTFWNLYKINRRLKKLVKENEHQCM